MAILELPFPPNSGYGAGAFRRRMRLRRQNNAIFATLDDSHHAMHCVLSHDGQRVLDIEAVLTRIPTTACGGAATVLRELIGLSLDTAMADLYGGGRARRNCTHLFDLAVLALRQARRNENERCYDACVPDEKNTPVTVEVRRNNQLIHAWQVSAGIITAPAVFAGQSLTTGFTPWALRTFANEAGADDALEAALVLHKSYYLAQARRYHTEAFAGQLLSANAVLQGVCHSYASGQIETARFTGNNVRDFSAAVIEAVVLE